MLHTFLVPQPNNHIPVKKQQLNDINSYQLIILAVYLFINLSVYLFINHFLKGDKQSSC